MNLSTRIPRIRAAAVILLCLLVCRGAARLWKAKHGVAGHSTRRLVDEPALRRRRRLKPLATTHHHPSRRRHLQDAYLVEVHLALYYLTEEVALAMESKDPSNSVVAHFCQNFNRQASGPQVFEAATERGDVYETRILDIADNATQDYDCQVVQANRVVANDTFDNIPDGQFILEVFVDQIVFVQSNRTISTDEVYNTVAQGFNRGTGGRVRFATLLKLLDAFSTLLDIDVIDGGFSIRHFLPTRGPSRAPTLATSSPPTRRPSNAPTTNSRTTTPSYMPSSTPSTAKSSSPSSAPSFLPSTIATSSSPVASSMSPTVAPSLSPSGKPETSSPTLDPTTMPPTTQPTSISTGTPNDQPTQQPSERDSQTAAADTSNDRKGLILGAIAGGVATIFVSCFFIFCVWFPLCGKRRSDHHSVPSDRPPRQQGSVSSSQSDGAEAAAAMIPGVVNLVDENASLADTTLGDQTTSILPPRKNKRLGETNGALNLLDSFDDNSLYTSSVAPTSALGGSSEPSEPSDQDQSLYSSHGMILPHSLDHTLDYEQNIMFPMSGSASDSGGDDGEEIQLRRIGHVDVEEMIQVVTVLSDSDDSDLASYGKQDDGSVDPVKELEDVKSDGGFSNPFSSIPAAASDEEKARDVSENMDRDGYDPFAEDTSGTSSFGFDNIEPLDVDSGNPYGQPQEIQDDRSSSSSDSSQTKRIEHLIVDSIPPPSDRERLGAISEIENRDVGESDGDDRDVKESNDSGRSPAREFFDNSEEANNNLLRTVLEDARLLAESKSPSLPSRASRKSAPPRMLKPAGSGHMKPKATPSIMTYLDEMDPKPRGASSMSVGGEPRPRDPRDRGEPAPKPPTRPTQNARQRREVSNIAEDVGNKEDSIGPSNDFLPYRTRFLDRVAVIKPHHFLPTAGSDGRSGSTPTAPINRKSETVMKLPEAPKHSTSPEQVEATSVSSGNSSVPSSAGGSGTGQLGAHPRSYGENWTAKSDDSVMHQPSESEDSSLFTPESSSPGLLGITGPQPGERGRKMLDDGASSNSDGSSTDWLFDVVEQTLGPRSAAADMGSLSGRSIRSEKSHKSTRSELSRKSRQSENKSLMSSGRNHSPPQKDFPFGTTNTVSSTKVYLESDTRLDEQKSESDEACITPRTLEHDLKRLQMQLADVLQTEMDQITTSSIVASSVGSALSAKRRAAAKKSNKNHVVLVVPPGKLGVVLANRHDGKGTVVSEVRPHSSMRGILCPGDRLVAVDGQDVTNMVVGEVTKLMASRSNAERRLTVITSAPPAGRDIMDEAKVEEYT